MTDSPDKRTGPVAKVDPAKRETLNRLLAGTAVAAPVVASFAMNGLQVNDAWAATNGSGSNVTLPPSPPAAI